MKKLKDNKGITLLILTTYIILTIIILGILAVLTSNFRGNINNMNVQTIQDTEFDKLNVQLLKETKTNNNFINSITDNTILFTNGNNYTYNETDGIVYLNNNIKIAEGISNLEFRIKN